MMSVQKKALKLSQDQLHQGKKKDGDGMEEQL